MHGYEISLITFGISRISLDFVPNPKSPNPWDWDDTSDDISVLVQNSNKLFLRNEFWKIFEDLFTKTFFRDDSMTHFYDRNDQTKKYYFAETTSQAWGSKKKFS